MVPGLMSIVERYYGIWYAALTLLLVLLVFLGVGVDPRLEMGLLLLGVVVLGLPHGALDTVVARQAFGYRQWYSQTGFSLVYLLVAVAYALLWWWLPLLTLTSFLMLSAWHFGSDWENKAGWWAQLAYGLAVVCLPVVLQRPQVEAVFAALGVPDAGVLLPAMQVIGPVAGAVAILRAIGGGRAWRQDLAEIVTIVGSALVLPPLLYFVTYFCFLHSPRHLLAVARETGISGWSPLLRAAGPAVAVSAGGGLLAWWLLPRASEQAGLLVVVFVGLAALTLPHMALAWLTQRERARRLA